MCARADTRTHTHTLTLIGYYLSPAAHIDPLMSEKIENTDEKGERAKWGRLIFFPFYSFLSRCSLK